MEAPPPSRTLYIRNLPDKLSKLRLRKLLHDAFSAHGRVVWVVAEKTMKLRGQAFITFEQQAGATAAVRALHSTEFMGRTIVVTYAKQLTDRAHGLAYGGDSMESNEKRTKRRKLQRERDEQQQKMQKDTNAAGPFAVGSGSDAPPPPQEEVTEPNKILFVQNVPNSIKKDGEDVEVADALNDLFARFAGFVEVRSVPGKDDIAFVEFSSDADAAVAMTGLHNHSLGSPPQEISVKFAKK